MSKKTRYFLNGEELHHVESLTVEYEAVKMSPGPKLPPLVVTFYDVALPLPPCEHGKRWYMCGPCVYRISKEQKEE